MARSTACVVRVFAVGSLRCSVPTVGSGDWGSFFLYSRPLQTDARGLVIGIVVRRNVMGDCETQAVEVFTNDVS